jgi:hypothetical protein
VDVLWTITPTINSVGRCLLDTLLGSDLDLDGLVVGAGMQAPVDVELDPKPPFFEPSEHPPYL